MLQSSLCRTYISMRKSAFALNSRVAPRVPARDILLQCGCCRHRLMHLMKCVWSPDWTDGLSSLGSKSFNAVQNRRQTRCFPIKIGLLPENELHL